MEVWMSALSELLKKSVRASKEARAWQFTEKAVLGSMASEPEENYLLASGARAGAQSEAQVFNNSVGIGGSPSFTLDVFGTTRFSVTSGTLLTSRNRWFCLSRDVGRAHVVWWADFDGTNWIGRHSSLHPARIGAGAAGGIRIETADNNGNGGTLGSWTTRLELANDGRIGIGTSSPAVSALLDLSSTTGALLLPRMTTTQRNALTAVNGMVIYNSSTDKFQGRAGGAWVDLH
jgi:hypothetical protein